MYPTLFRPVSGKRPSQPLIATSVAGHSHSLLFYVEDHISGLSLIDKGAEVSLVPPSAAERKHPQTRFSLQAANSSIILTFGSPSTLVYAAPSNGCSLSLMLKNSVLGADFPNHFSLIIDINNRRLFDKSTQFVIRATPTHTSVRTV